VTPEQRRTRYLRIVRWAARRYTEVDGRLPTLCRGQPTPYARIEQAAWDRYLTPPDPACPTGGYTWR
jgi:hypothetical protein